MSDSILQVNQIKDKGGNATGITVADSSANVTIGNLTASGGNLGTITQRSASSSGITFTRSSGTAIDSTVLGNLYGTTNVKPNDSSSTTHAWLRFSYTTAVKVTKLQWLQVDGGGAGSTVNNHLSFEGSNVASPDAGAGHSDWTILSSFSTPYTNGDILNYSGANNAIKYKHYRIRWGWASGGNYCNIHSFVLEDTDSTFDIKAPLNATGSAPIYACRAFGRTGTGSAHSNFVGKNLNYSKSSSEHTFTFTNPPSNDDYTVVSSAGRYGSNYGWILTLTSKTSSAFKLKMCNLTGTLIDDNTEGVDVAVYF